MDTAYYVMHPSLGVTAVVYAPATEKARTTFLDWLERKGYINRSDRQAWRKNMVAEKLEDPQGVSSDVRLHYDYQDVSTPIVRIGEDSISPPVGGEPIEPKEDEVPSLENVVFEQPEKEGPSMPIQKVMLRGFS